MAQWTRNRLGKWVEPELFQPFIFGVLFALTLSEFVRGALTLSLLPTYGRTVLGFAVEWTALSLSVHYLVDNLLRSPAGWLADKLGQRTVLLIGFAISALAVFWMMNARTIPSLIASLALYGIGVTPVWPSAVSGIGLATPEKSRASFMGYMYIFWLVGTGLGPVLINFLIGRTYWPAFSLLLTVEVVGFVLVWLLVRRAGIRNHQATTKADTEQVTHRIDRAHWVALWKNVRQVIFLFPGMFAQTFAVASLVPILSLYARVVLHISGAMYSGVLVAGGALTVILLIPAGRLVDRLGSRLFLVCGFLLAGGVLFVYPFFHTLSATYIAVGALGAGYAFILPAWNAVLDKSIDPDKKGTLWGVFMTVEGLGSAAGPYLGGLVWDRVSPEAPFFVSASVILIMGVLYMFLPIEAARQRRRYRDGQSAGARLSARGKQRT